MTIILSLEPQKEAKLAAIAQSKGLSADQLVSAAIDKIISDAPDVTDSRPSSERFTNLSDLLLNSPFAGANLNLERAKDHPRTIDLG